jgi:hypothetical protein
MRKASAVALAFSLLWATPLSAQDDAWYELSARRQIEGVRVMQADIEYAVGRLHISSAPQGLLYDTKLRYDSREFEPSRTWSIDGGAGQLGLSLSTLDGEWDLGDLDEFDDSDLGALDLALSREVPTALSLTVGAAVVDMDLGGIALQRFVYRTGASETHIDFETPNPVRMDRLELAAGVAEFVASGLGNARFDYMEFAGAIGDVSLDFTGDWDGSASGDIKMGLGSLLLTFPRDIGVRIEKKGLLASFDSSGFEAVDGGYQTANWDTAKNAISLDIRAAFGNIDVTFVN